MNRVEPLALAAGIVFFDKSNRVLLVHQTYGLKAWSMPGGKLERRRNAMIFGFVGQLPDDAEPVISDAQELDDIGWFSIDRPPSPTRTSLRFLLADAAAGRLGVSRTVSSAETE